MSESEQACEVCDDTGCPCFRWRDWQSMDNGCECGCAACGINPPLPPAGDKPPSP